MNIYEDLSQQLILACLASSNQSGTRTVLTSRNLLTFMSTAFSVLPRSQWKLQDLTDLQVHTERPYIFCFPVKWILDISGRKCFVCIDWTSNFGFENVDGGKEISQVQQCSVKVEMQEGELTLIYYLLILNSIKEVQYTYRTIPSRWSKGTDGYTFLSLVILNKSWRIVYLVQ